MCLGHGLHLIHSMTTFGFWIVPGVLGLKLSCRHLNFAGRKQGTQAENFRSSLKSPAKKGGVPPKKEQISGFNIRSNASMSLIITQYFPCIFHGVFHGNPPISDGRSHQNRGHQCLQRQRHALVAALAATKPLERLAQQRRQVALSLQAVQALQRLGFGPWRSGDEVQLGKRQHR